MIHRAPTRNRSLAKINGNRDKGIKYSYDKSSKICFKEQLVTGDTFTIARDAVKLKVSTIRIIHYSWNITS